MKKRELSGELVVLGVFVVLMIFLIIFGKGFTGFAVYEGGEVFDGKIGIEIGNSYSPGDNINFKIVLYDGDNNPLAGEVNFEIQNFYAEVIEQGVVKSGEIVNFKLPENAWRGHWGVVARYKGLESRELFNVMELEKVDIKLEGDKLVVTNVGNVPYRKSIQISIGGNEETALVPLGIGETKEIKLTAPSGEYDVRVSDGTEENTKTFSGVSLTGNVVGLQSLKEKGFFGKYPMISLFFVVVVIAVVVIFGLRMMKKG